MWVDIACIDQNSGSRDSAAEIGRQAKIFRGASVVFAWLTSHLDALEEEFPDAEQALDSLGNSPDAGTGPDQSSGQRVADFFSFLTRDPWFSSLWTLQEAFLCPEAIFITRKARLWSPVEGKEEMLRLKDIVGMIDMLHGGLYYDDRDQLIHHIPGFLTILERSGLLGLLIQIPIILLSVAQYRKTSPINETDRVYGIMQVFNMRLGKSRPNADPTKDFTLSELEDELGEDLLKQQPVMSQLHIFTERPDVGKGWRVGRRSRMANDLNSDVYYDLNHTSHIKTSSAVLSTTSMNGTLWGTFSGPTCAFSVLCTAWGSYRKPWREHEIPMEIELDCTPPRRFSYTQHDYHINRARALTHDRPDATVLMLGQCMNTHYGVRPTTPCHTVGLILAPYDGDREAQNSKRCWQRIGICTWRPHDFDDGGYDADVDSFLWGSSGDWTMADGFFG